PKRLFNEKLLLQLLNYRLFIFYAADSPPFRALNRLIITATKASPVILVDVRSISKGLSTANINAIPAGLTPIDSKTMTSISRPAPGTAAEPIDASVAVSMT